MSNKEGRRFAAFCVNEEKDVEMFAKKARSKYHKVREITSEEYLAKYEEFKAQFLNLI